MGSHPCHTNAAFSLPLRLTSFHRPPRHLSQQRCCRRIHVSTRQHIKPHLHRLRRHVSDISQWRLPSFVYNTGAQESRYYLSILHAPSKTQIWTANHNTPMPDRSSTVNLTPKGLSVNLSNGTVLWSNPPPPSPKAPVSALRLLETGNLMLLDGSNFSLWESFHYPSDTLVSNQVLPAGSNLSSSVSGPDLSQGDYQLDVTSADALLNWSNNTYWRLSNDKLHQGSGCSGCTHDHQ